MGVNKRIAATGVLVAHDGSEHADEALRVGVRHATALGLPVTIVRAWSITTAPKPETWEFGYVPPLEDFETAVLAELERDARRVVPDDLDVTFLAVHAKPAPAIIAASEGLELIVVGSRGRGGFAGLVLGSVSEQIVRYASCPVLVTHHRGDVSRDEPEEDLTTIEQALLSELKLD